MADSLYLSLWFPTFRAVEMLPRALSVLHQFPFSPAAPGVCYVAVQPISWSEPSVLERRFATPVPPEEAADAVHEFVHEDYALVFEAYWDLWSPLEEGAAWTKRESLVRFILHGAEFDEGAYAEQGHIEIDFGLDYPFLHEEMNLSRADEERVRANVAQLVAFTQAVEKHCGLTTRILWSENEENLAQKLTARLQRVQ